jgi:hypothetical protein
MFGTKVRYNEMRTSLLLGLLAGMCLPIWIGAQVRPARTEQASENAAVKYLRADASLRQSYVLAPDAAAKLVHALETPLDAEDEKLVAAAKDALIEFHHGATLKRCEWSMSEEDGPLANTAHRGAIMELAAVSGLRARLRFRDGDSSGAISDVLAAMAAARHLSVDGSLASVLFAYKLENALREILAQNLSRFSPGQLKELSSGLNFLPSGSSLGTAFESEKVRRSDFVDVVHRTKSRNELIVRLLNRAPILESNRALAAEIVDGCGGSVGGFEACANRQHSFYEGWAPRFSLPPEEFERVYKAEIEQASRANPLIRQFTPALPRFRWAEAYSQTRRALLQTAIAIRLEGRSALDRHPDPYDGNPFSYIPVDEGFRLESRLRESGAPLSLSIVPSL